MTIKNKDNILICNDNTFNPQDILECGQVFRYRLNEGVYTVFSLDKMCTVTPIANGWRIDTDDVDYFYNYFDLDRDYNCICDRVSAYGDVLARAVEYGRGIRILNQDLYEMVFSFIISANNNIKRIQGIIERICIALGTKTKYGYAFPTVEQMARASVMDFARMGAGYRADYLYCTARQLLDEKCNLRNRLINCDTASARKILLTYKGVGPKVADCILLFGLKRPDVFPVDTWMEKVYHCYFESGCKQKEIAPFFINYFGADAGYAQQYLFYFQRESIAKSK